MVGAVQRVDHAAGAQEQERLEEGVGREVEDPGRIRAAPHAQEHVAELRDGGVREHLLDVPLLQPDRGGEQRGERSRAGDDGARDRGQGEQHGAAGHQIDAGRHHGGGVDQRRNGGRALHGVREPRVQGDLRRLAGAPEKQEQRDRGDRPVARAERGGCPGEDRREVERARVAEDEQHRHQEPEVPDAVDDERLEPRVGVDLFVEPEADEQVGAQPHPFPPDEHHGEARAEHERQHEEDEQIQLREVPSISGIVVHVADAVQVNQGADPRDDEHHHPRQRVELERVVHLERSHGQPGPVVEHGRRAGGWPQPRELPHDRDGERERGGEDANAD